MVSELSATYYSDKVDRLKDIFGTEQVAVFPDRITVNGAAYPVLNDVIILAEPEHWPPGVKTRLGSRGSRGVGEQGSAFAEDIQYSFGEEWARYREVRPEHQEEFRNYFDLLDLDALAGRRVCDVGCGMGRWSTFLRKRVKEIILVDFSEAIFTARENLRDAPHCLFFLADLTALPFREDCVDFLFCLGVLHHLPTPALREVRNLGKFAPLMLIFVYYALDNRPWHYRILLRPVTLARMILSRIRNRGLRKAIAVTGTYLVYLPLIWIGRLLQPLGWSSHVPLYDFYHDKSPARIEQDVYDRFFTAIEQRVTREEILELRDSFSEVVISEHFPYWHFLCRR